MTARERRHREAAIGKEEGERPATCPFCGSSDTELFGLFGNMQLASQYYCNGCRTVFDYVAWRREIEVEEASET
ncbi:MAG: hypothetical protein M3220_00590 [Chloroflexota bacterium]|nr:hypothetical protein [Chloroflexota bacterium]